MAVDLRGDVSDAVLATLVMAPVSMDGPRLLPAVAEDPFWDPHLFPRGIDDSPLSHPWGSVLGQDLSDGGFPGEAGVSLRWDEWRGRWNLTARTRWQASSVQLAQAITWLGPWTCPDASPDAQQLVGYIKHEDDNRPALVWHDGRRFLFEGLDEAGA